MDLPQIPGYTIHSLMAHGACGDSHLATGPSGEACVVKVFKTMSINRRLLGETLERIASAGEMEGVLPVIDYDLDQRPPYLIEPLIGKVEGDVCASRSLYDYIGSEIASDTAWEWVLQLCRGVAGLHRLGLAHCNLKPGNVLVDEAGGGALFVSDYGQGWVHGIYQMDPSSSYLHAPPEQLLHPDGVDSGGGGRWDVYAFGVLAYRLLTGHFPRGHGAFSHLEKKLLARDPSVQSLTPAQVANALNEETNISWPSEAQSWAEQQRRRVIEYCLRLDPDERWIDLREVEREFLQVESEVDLRRERQRVIDYKHSMNGKLKTFRLAAAGFAGLFVLTAGSTLVYRHLYKDKSDALVQAEDDKAKALAAKDAEIAIREAEVERKISEARRTAAGAVAGQQALLGTLVKSQEQADLLFDLVMDKRPVQSPGFREYSDTVGELEKFYTEYLSQFESDEGMEVERARAMTKLAELSLAAGRNEQARERFSAAAGQWRPIVGAHPEDEDSRGRLAVVLLKLSRLEFQADDIDAARMSVDVAQNMLELLTKTNGGDVEYGKWLAESHVQKGLVMRQQGDVEAAIAEYRRAVELYRTLGDRTGDFNFRSDLAHSYIELGKLVRGTDNFEAALMIQKDALATLVEMNEERPELVHSKFEQARAFGEIAEIQLELGEIEEARKMKTKAVDLLRDALKEAPDQNGEELRFELAKHLSGLARALRDSGQSSNARRELDEAMKLFDELVDAHPEKSLYRYRRALAMWQSAEMISGQGQHSEARKINEKAVVELRRLLDEGGLAEDQKRQIEISLAYLFGDLAHISEVAKEREDAVGFFRKAEKQWSHIASQYGEDPMISDALVWCRRRLSDLSQ
ncbi:protein kinase domain-containing protein [Sulfuriroseicoccus oceanibius]|uniref:Protein kinase domain-containing protein n=1 Tax=Sulfuriroseicoccus oceanibius TaxID=2707525 RepID=A0A6B3LGQ7_9BACT|nr:hypothetical protein [Sulfuriroseicoccus oceanibius]QQL45897.1 hypothetical protein G3M56_004765 [Sulfuriroseicoccus oceanibius]